MCIQQLHLFILLIANFIDYMINRLVEYLNSENMAWCITSKTCWAEPVTYLRITSLVRYYFFG